MFDIPSKLSGILGNKAKRPKIKNKDIQKNQSNRISRNWSYQIDIKITMINMFKKINERWKIYQRTRILKKRKRKRI